MTITRILYKVVIIGVFALVIMPIRLADAGDAKIVMQSENVVWIWDGINSLLRSMDGGATWEEKACPEPGQGQVAFSDANHGLVCGRNGIWRTADGGEAWSHVTINEWGPGGQVIMGTNKDAVACSSRRLWLSDDGGKTWKADVLDACKVLKNGDTHILYTQRGTTWVYQEYGRPLVEGLFRITSNGECTEWFSFQPGSVFEIFGGIRHATIIILTGGNNLHHISTEEINQVCIPSNYLPNQFGRILDLGYVGQEILYLLAEEKETDNVTLLIGSSCGVWHPRASWPRGQVHDIEFRDEYYAIAVGRNGYLAYTEDQGITWNSMIRTRKRQQGQP